MTVIDLLADSGNGAKSIKAEQKAAMTKQQYLSYMRKIYKEEVYQN